MNKPVVNQEACLGCGTCEAICPEVFKLEEVNGEMKAIVKEVDYEANKEKIQEAIDSCAVQAISLG